MKIRQEHNWICDECGRIKVHSILNNGETGTTYCGACDCTVTVHKEIRKFVEIKDLIKELDKFLTTGALKVHLLEYIKAQKTEKTKQK